MMLMLWLWIPVWMGIAGQQQDAWIVNNLKMNLQQNGAYSAPKRMPCVPLWVMDCPDFVAAMQRHPAAASLDEPGHSMLQSVIRLHELSPILLPIFGNLCV
ncbi:MAG: hypothetical protein JO174_22000 [Herbaspirillum sp.]|nr:hypothetical protein [Herbaspirillum sp.]